MSLYVELCAVIEDGSMLTSAVCYGDVRIVMNIIGWWVCVYEYILAGCTIMYLCTWKTKSRRFLEFFLHSSGSLLSIKFPKRWFYPLRQNSASLLFNKLQFLPILGHRVRQKFTFTRILKLVWLIIMRISLYSWW